MSSDLKTKITNSKFFSKLKKIKHIEIIVIVVFICILMLIYFSDGKSQSKTEQSSGTFTSYKSYTNDLESRLSDVLSKIKGAGKVSVMITLDASPELVIAYDTQEKTSGGTNESKIITKEPIIITRDGTSSPLVLSEVLPDVKGVLIVAQGANDVAVKLNLIQATSKLLNVSVNSIEIFAGE